MDMKKITVTTLRDKKSRGEKYTMFGLDFDGKNI